MDLLKKKKNVFLNSTFKFPIMEFAHYDKVIHNSVHKWRQVELVYSNSHITKVWIRCDKHGKYSFPGDKKKL